MTIGQDAQRVYAEGYAAKPGADNPYGIINPDASIVLAGAWMGGHMRAIANREARFTRRHRLGITDGRSSRSQSSRASGVSYQGKRSRAGWVATRKCRFRSGTGYELPQSAGSVAHLLSCTRKRPARYPALGML